MKDFLLEIVYAIMGVGAASGIWYRNDTVYLISDDSNYLYAYSADKGTLQKTLLVTGDKTDERLPKKMKRDFEAIAFDETNFYVYGSGSSDDGKRNMRSVVSSSGEGPAQTQTLTPLYTRLQQQFAVDIDNFNIEGVIHYRDDIYLFNRGNGPRAVNGVFKIGGNRDTTFIPVELPSLNGVGTGFTDAILVDDTVYFLAAAEDAGSVYHDGAVQGTVLGRLSFPGMELLHCVQISDTHKFEGLTLFADSIEKISFLLCEDPDDGSAKSTIYKLTLTK